MDGAVLLLYKSLVQVRELPGSLSPVFTNMMDPWVLGRLAESSDLE